MNVPITIGWTRSDMAKGYSSFSGYRHGAEQHTETIEIDLPTDVTPEQVGEYVFDATNNPFVPANSVAGQIAAAIEATGYHGREAHYSLSIGDTVTLGEVTVACDSFGWKRISIDPALLDEVMGR